jgi:hypothetical protein
VRGFGFPAVSARAAIRWVVLLDHRSDLCENSDHFGVVAAAAGVEIFAQRRGAQAGKRALCRTDGAAPFRPADLAVPAGLVGPALHAAGPGFGGCLAAPALDLDEAVGQLLRLPVCEAEIVEIGAERVDQLLIHLDAFGHGQRVAAIVGHAVGRVVAAIIGLAGVAVFGFGVVIATGVTIR